MTEVFHWDKWTLIINGQDIFVIMFVVNKLRAEWGQEMLISFGAESFVFQVVIQKFKAQDILNYNFADCFVWVWKLFVDIVGGKEAEGVWEHGAEENIWT